ncbi:hypothetical protein D3C84_780710 [compost metagenome]
MIAELRIGLQHVVDHEAAVLVGVGVMHPVLGQHLAQHVDVIAGAGDLQLDQQILKLDLGIEAADFLQSFAPKQQGRCRRSSLVGVEHALKIQAPERPLAIALDQGVAATIDLLDVASTDTHFRLALQVSHLQGDALRQHDVVGAERCNQAALGANDAVVQGSGQALVGLRSEVEPILRLQRPDSFDAVVLRAVVHHQQLDARIALLQHAADAGLDIGTMVVGGDDHADQGLLVHSGLSSPSSLSSNSRYCRRKSSMACAPRK